jgi:hypothetical protein
MPNKRKPRRRSDPVRPSYWCGTCGAVRAAREAGDLPEPRKLTEYELFLRDNRETVMMCGVEDFRRWADELADSVMARDFVGRRAGERLGDCPGCGRCGYCAAKQVLTECGDPVPDAAGPYVPVSFGRWEAEFQAYRAAYDAAIAKHMGGSNRAKRHDENSKGS